MRRLIRRRAGDDRGAAALLVAIVLSLAMLGLGGLVVDAGGWYAEKSQLQNGADAAALAVAQTCVTTCDTATGAGGTAGNYANTNAGDGTSTVDEVCGHGPGLAACSHADCPGQPGAYPSASWVDVHTSTRTSSGGSTLPVTLGRLLPGETVTGVGIPACAQAAWGSPSPADGIALTISYCAWNRAIGADPANYVPAPYHPTAANEYRFSFHGNAPGTDKNDPSCTPSPSGAQIPGGFGHTCEVGASNCAQSGTVCRTDLTALPNGWYGSNTGNALDSLCSDTLYDAWLNHTPLLIPVFDCVSSISGCLSSYPCPSCSQGGNNAAYHLQSLAAFVVTAYRFQNGGPHNSELSWVPGSAYATKAPCSGNDSCIAGFFTTDTTSGDLGSGGANYGVTAIRMTG